MFFSRCVTITITTIVVIIIVAATMFYFMSNGEQNDVMSSIEKMNPFREKTTMEKAQDAILDAKDELEYGIKKTMRHITD